MKQAILLFVLCACLTVTASAQTLAEKLDALVSTASILRTSEVGICVYDLTAGIPIYRYQADKLYRPASIEKIVTAVTALSELGKDYPYQTRLSYSGTIAEGRLKGDVYVVGGFDPEFMESDLELLADDKGISGEIEGIKPVIGRNRAAFSAGANNPRVLYVDDLQTWQKFQASKYAAQKARIKQVCDANYWISRFALLNLYGEAVDSKLIGPVAKRYEKKFASSMQSPSRQPFTWRD